MEIMQKLHFDAQTAPVLLVALLTWGGVFFYLLRLERLAKKLEAGEAGAE